MIRLRISTYKFWTRCRSASLKWLQLSYSILQFWAILIPNSQRWINNIVCVNECVFFNYCCVGSSCWTLRKNKSADKATMSFLSYILYNRSSKRFSTIILSTLAVEFYDCAPLSFQDFGRDCILEYNAWKQKIAEIGWNQKPKKYLTHLLDSTKLYF